MKLITWRQSFVEIVENENTKQPYLESYFEKVEMKAAERY